MTTTAGTRTPEEVKADLDAERGRLADAVEHLRGSLEEATTGRLRAKLPLAAAGAAATGFVLAGGIGAAMRYLARRSREDHDATERARVGRYSIFERD